MNLDLTEAQAEVYTKLMFLVGNYQTIMSMFLRKTEIPLSYNGLSIGNSPFRVKREDVPHANFVSTCISFWIASVIT